MERGCCSDHIPLIHQGTPVILCPGCRALSSEKAIREWVEIKEKQQQTNKKLVLSFKKFCSSVSSLETIVENLVTLNTAFKRVLHNFECPNSYDSTETDRCRFGFRYMVLLLSKSAWFHD